jgi:hypothetical protein
MHISLFTKDVLPNLLVGQDIGFLVSNGRNQQFHIAYNETVYVKIGRPDILNEAVYIIYIQ